MASRHISTTETAKLIRRALRESFPGTKFSVRSRSYAGGSSVDVSWTDGPTAHQVEAVAKRFAGATFDGMRDCKTYQHTLFDGEATQFGPDFVFCTRTHSVEAIARVLALLARRYGAEAPGAEDYASGRGWNLYCEPAGDYWSHLASLELAKRTRCPGPRPSATLGRFDAPAIEAPAPVRTPAPAANTATQPATHTAPGAFTIGQARYAKGQVLVRIPNTSGFKTRAERLAGALRGRWSNRERGYVMSPTKAKRLEKLYQEGWDAGLLSGELEPPASMRDPDADLVAVQWGDSSTPEKLYRIPSRELLEYRRQRAAMVPVLRRARLLRFALRDLELVPRARALVETVLARAERQRNAGFAPLLAARAAALSPQIENSGARPLELRQISTQRPTARAMALLEPIELGPRSVH